MNLFKPIDLHLAAFILRERATPETTQLVAYLSSALRQGYSSIRIGGQIYPPPTALCEENPFPSEEEQIALHTALRKGKELIITQNLSSLVIEGDQLAFELYHTLHKRFQHLYRERQSSTPYPLINPQLLQTEVQQLETQGAITHEQAEAITKGCMQSLTTIMGGPGTGKTYTAGLLLNTFRKLLRGSPCKIALTAPTGKAAANLQKSFEKFSHSWSEGHSIQAQTLHALLKLGKNRDPQPIDADLIIVDESSMIDSKRMVNLFDAVKPSARLILMGDPNQLPPVEVGELFAALIHTFSGGTKLTRCQRTDLLSIVEMARNILAGKGDSVPLYSDLEPFLEEALKAFTPPQQALPAELLRFFNQYRILSPLNQGPWGCETLNKRLLTRLRKSDQPIVAPILITKNDRTFSLNNGEVGVLIAKDPFQYQAGDVAYFEGASGVRKIPAIALPEHTWGFCLSVHKSQGSEFDRVLLLWPEGAERFGRPGLYTGVTRAKKEIHIVADPKTFAATLAF